ncbi:hypothetical protein QVD17_03694 [Tagetes erecta]|uniref:Uncharacterized protein n=1 Tax=Tagetes erecta TaxID=13708 RepID=A0AAD8L8T0_TARER|nr:hypothetical protein QVD17_03694 [Tagetes erecta]
MPYSTSHVSMWECSSSRLEGNHEGSELAFDFEKENGMDDEISHKVGVRLAVIVGVVLVHRKVSDGANCNCLW